MIFDNKIFFYKSYKNSKRRALKYFGIKKRSYASTIIDRLYDYYYDHACNAFIEYLRYYKKEYSSFDQYLINHFNFEAYEISSKKKYRLYYKKISSRPMNPIISLVYDDDFIKSFLSFIDSYNVLGDENNEN